jgi:hypothetical protein
MTYRTGFVLANEVKCMLRKLNLRMMISGVQYYLLKDNFLFFYYTYATT